MKKNKKGISAIIATVLVILITIAVAAIVSVTVVPMVRDQLRTATLCSDATSQIQLLNEGFTCWKNDSSSVNISFQVNRLSKDFNLVGFQVLAFEGGNSKSFEINSTDGLPSAPGTKVYEIEYSTINPENVPDKIEIAPVVSSGEGSSKTTCDVSSTVALREC